jgi:hypothetical protein
MSVSELFSFPIFWLWAYLNYLAFQSFDYERIWINQLSNLLTMSVSELISFPISWLSVSELFFWIIWLSNLLTMNVSELFGFPISWLWAYLNYLALQSFDYEHTWIQKRVVHIKFDMIVVNMSSIHTYFIIIRLFMYFLL